MRLLITGAWQDGLNWQGEIINLNHEVLFMEQETDSLPCVPEWVEGIVCNAFFLYHDFAELSNLRFIQLTSAGLDRLPLEVIRNTNIEIHNATGVYSIPMAEYAVGGVLQIYRQTAFFYNNMQRHIWEKHRGLLELSGKTVCIVGCGNIGRECAKRFKAFGCEIVEVHRDLNGLDNIKSADVVIVTIALTKETFHLIKPSQMKSGSVLVSISRGAVIDETDMVATLCSGRISAVLDVFEEEPLSEKSPLWGLQNVIITPHNSFIGEGNKARLAKVIMENLRNEYQRSFGE